MEDILSAYEIEKHPLNGIVSPNVYDWKETKESEFTKELHEISRRILGKNIKATPYRVIEMTILFVIAVSQLYMYGRGEWYALFTMPLAVWVFGVNIFHDASHFSLSNNWKINVFGLNCGFMFNTPFVWYH
jgi:fatty acid desaturase